MKKGDLVAVVESEKASFDVEAFAEGVVVDLPYKEGDTVTVLAPLVRLAKVGEAAASPAPPTTAGNANDAAVTALASAARVAPVAAVAVAAATGRTLRSSPVARRVAARHGVDLARLAGTGTVGVFEGSTQLFSVAAALRRFDGPTTIISGRDDAMIPFREVAAQVPPNAALHRLDRTGHLPQVEAPEFVRTPITRTVRAAG